MNSSASNTGRPTSVVTPSKPHNVDNETIINILKLAHARSQRLVETWVPYTEEELQTRQQDSNARAAPAADGKLFFRSERAGLGAEATNSKEVDLQSARPPTFPGSELEKLKKQLLGRKAAAKSAAARSSQSLGNQDNRKPKSENGTRQDEDESDEEEGRSSLFASKKSKQDLPIHANSSFFDEKAATGKPHILGNPSGKEGTKESTGVQQEELASVAINKSRDGIPAAPPPKRQHSILDQAIAEKAKKKRKRHKNK